MSTFHRIQLPTVKPRNPLAIAARMSHAGSHRAAAGSRRQQDRQALRRELRAQHPPQP
jgi:hypothetical protein